jgi:hypothetical protein
MKMRGARQVLVLVTGSVAVFLPDAFDCEPATRQLMMKESMGCLSQADMHQLSHGEVNRDHLIHLLGELNQTKLAGERAVSILESVHID